MVLPHVSVKTRDIKGSSKFYRSMGYDMGNPTYCDSLGGAHVVFGYKKGFPVIELVESEEEGTDHVTVAEDEVDLSKVDIIEVNEIPELGITTKLFYGPNGEKLEAVFKERGEANRRWSG